MTSFCINDDDPTLSGLKCATFVTFIVSHAILLLLALSLYIHHRWLQTIEKRLLIADLKQSSDKFRLNNRESENTGGGRNSSAS